MPLPPAHMIVGAAASEAVAAGTALPRLRVCAVGAGFGLLPDLDCGIRVLTGEFAPIERSALHRIPPPLSSPWRSGSWPVATGAISGDDLSLLCRNPLPPQP